MDDHKNPSNLAPIAAWAGHGLRPPEGYNSFLEYAVATMDTRSLELKDIFSDENNRPSREDFRQAVTRNLTHFATKLKIYNALSPALS